jgi:hypothetical protein
MVGVQERGKLDDKAGCISMQQQNYLTNKETGRM